MRIAIIGGKGLIGRSLAHELADAGHVPVVLSRHAATGEQQGTAQVLHWDGKSEKQLADLIDGLDALVNLAGESIGASRWTKKRLGEIYDSRLIPGKAISNAWAMMTCPPATLIQASAVGFYGSTDRPTDENYRQGKDQLAQLCREWEASTQPVVGRGTRHVIIRSGVVFDRSHGILPQMALPFRLFAGGPIGSGNQWVSWVHIIDEVRAIRWLLERSTLTGVFNLTSPNPVTNAEFGRTLAKVIHRPYWFPVPAFALRMALGKMSGLILEGQKVVPSRLAASGFEFRYPDLDKALSNLLGIQ